MPDHPALQSAYLAWDRGEYPSAVTGYLDVLRGPEGAAWVEEVALLTGELFQVTEVTTDGRDIVVAPDGSLGAFQAEGPEGPVLHLVDMRTGAVVDRLAGSNVALGPNGSLAYLEIDETPEVLAARRAVAAADNRMARMQAAAEAAWAEARAASLVVRASPDEHGVVDMNGLIPLGFTFSASGDLFVLAAPAETRARMAAYRVSDAGPVRLPLGEEVFDLAVSADGRTVVGMGRGFLTVLRPDGAASRIEGAGRPTLSRDGRTLAYLREGEGTTRLEALDLSVPGTAPRVLVETDKRIDNPAASPNGRWVAYQLMDLHDWEIFAAASDGSGERRLSLEIQHDRNPIWVDDTHVLAAKGEGRHMRSYLYDVEGGETIKLFHNNTIRTIAPEYDWALAPGTGKLLIVAERDGDTVSPERGVYLLDLEAKVTRDQVIARLERALETEEGLRARGAEAFAPIRDEVAMVADAVSVGRIYDYARAVYQFGSKHITMPGNALAIEYYADKLRSFGYEPELQWFEGRGVRSANVIVRIPGTVDPELVYVASSHFDSTQRGPGADDDSSGATALLEVARVLKDHPMAATIELAFFTGEEAGLLGSREYVRRAIADGKRVVGALNNDMIGWANNHRLDNTIRYSNPGIRDIQHAAAMMFSDLITYDALYYKSTDAAAYYEAYGDIVGGIGSYPVLGNPHYHQWTDRLETINQQLVAEVARTTAATLMLLASSPSRINGLVVEGDIARWQPSPERGIVSYEVTWETQGLAREWMTSQVREPTIRLDARKPGGRVMVRALGQNGTHGWDWAKVEPGG